MTQQDKMHIDLGFLGHFHEKKNTHKKENTTKQSKQNQLPSRRYGFL